MDLVGVERLLNDVVTNYKLRDREDIRSVMKEQKSSALDNHDDILAKRIWCLEAIFETQNFYVDTFKLIEEKKYYDAWCLLERAEISLSSARKHVKENQNEYQLEFMNDHISRLQSLFPYKIFMSPEFVGTSNCSVCDAAITPRSRCAHIAGEIYRGEMCVRIFKQATFLGMALVENPVQKYSVPFADGKDTYNYSLVEYFVEKILDPFTTWTVEETVKIHPHSQIKKHGRNALCPCGSEKKYKRCCLLSNGVPMPHFQFDFSNVKKGASLHRELYLGNKRERTSK